MTTRRILIADDHQIVREGVRALVERQPGWEICGEAANGRDAVALALELQPEIVIVDIGMPELNGLEAARQITRALPKTEVLIFSGQETEQVVRSVFKSGAKAYLLKSDASQHLIPALEALARHRTYFSTKVSEMIFAGYLKDEDGRAGSDPRLTGRERETLQLIAEGRTNKEIGTIFGISVKTVETHRATIMRKLALKSVAELVRYAIRNGIIEA